MPYSGTIHFLIHIHEIVPLLGFRSCGIQKAELRRFAPRNDFFNNLLDNEMNEVHCQLI